MMVIYQTNTNNTMEAKRAAEGVLLRNEHLNLFQLKVPSHHASRQSVENMSQAFLLNKLSLLPFHHDQQLTHLYRQTLENLLQLPLEHFKNE